MRDPVEHWTRDLLDHVDLACHVARAPGRHGDVPVVRDLETEALEGGALLVRGNAEPDHERRPLGAKTDDGPFGKPVVDVDVAGHPRAREIDDHPAREDRRVLREVRVDALLPAVGTGCPEPESLGRAEDPERLEVRRFEQHLVRALRDLALLASHDRGERDRMLAVGDHEIFGNEPAERAVERAQLLASPGTAYDDSPTRELRAIEGMERAPPHVHDVVRDVHDVRDRSHVGEVQARTKPLGRRADRDVAEHPSDVARASVEVLDRDLDGFDVDDRGIVRCRRVELSVQQRRDLPRETDHREEIDPVDRRRDVEHVIADREDVGEWRSRLRPVLEHHDPGVILAEADLVLGEDHSPRELPAKGAFVERLVQDREIRSRERDRDRRTGLEVPCAADDLPRVAFSDVHLAHAEPVGVRVRRRLEHAADEEAAEISVGVGDAGIDDALDLERRDREPVRDLVGGGVDRDVLAEPREWRAHQWCLR